MLRFRGQYLSNLAAIANIIERHVAERQPINAQLLEIPGGLSNYREAQIRGYSRAIMPGLSDGVGVHVYWNALFVSL